MSVEHKSLRDEILFLLGRSSAPLTSGEIYERCTLAEEIKRVTDALWVLRDTGKIEVAEGEGRKRYRPASGVAAPAPAGKAGRPTNHDPDAAQAAPLTGIRPALEIPILGEPAPSPLRGEGGGKGGAPVDDAEVANGLDLVERRQADARLADALLSHTREQLAPGSDYARSPDWWIAHDGSVEILGDEETITLSRAQASRLAKLVTAFHFAMVNV